MNKWTNENIPLRGGSDPNIARFLAQTGFKVLLSLSGAAGGLYVAAQLPDQRAIYLGPFVGMAAIYGLWRWIMGVLRGQKAISYEIITHDQKR